MSCITFTELATLLCFRDQLLHFCTHNNLSTLLETFLCVKKPLPERHCTESSSTP